MLRLTVLVVTLLTVGCTTDDEVDAAVDAAVGFDAGCSRFEAPVVTGIVASPDIDELSGLVASRRQTDLLFAHNDSGDSARIFALSTSGEHLGEVALDGITAIDFEDIALEPGATTDRLLVADIGDNGAARASVTVYRFDEPSIPGVANIDVIEAIELTYPDGPRDAEAIFVDPDLGDLYVVSKHLSRPSRVYVARAPLSTTEVTELEDLGMLPNLRLTGGGISGAVTGIDVSPDGQLVAIRTYGAVWEWVRDGLSFAALLATTPTRAPEIDERQGESVAYAADGSGLFTVDEGASPPVHFLRARACP